MFDKHYHVKGRTELVPYEKTINITEKRASTDESIKILREMEQKALDQVIGRLWRVTVYVSKENIIKEISQEVEVGCEGFEHADDMHESLSPSDLYLDTQMTIRCENQRHNKRG